MASAKSRAIIAEIRRQAYRDGFEDGRKHERIAGLSKRRQTSRRHVAAVIVERLSAGPQPAEAMLAVAKEFGTSEKCVYRAKAEMGIVSYQARRGEWYWAKPEDVPPKSDGQMDNQLALVA